MNKNELRKEFDAKWKQENQTKYVVWLIFYVGSFVPLLVGCLPMFMEGPNDSNVSGAICGIVIMFVMEIVALILNRDRAAAWKAYLKEHQK